jgi:hypothetical protein
LKKNCGAKVLQFFQKFKHFSLNLQQKIQLLKCSQNAENSEKNSLEWTTIVNIFDPKFDPQFLMTCLHA